MLVKIAQIYPGVAPVFIQANISSKILFIELGIKNVAIEFIFIIGSSFGRTIKPPHETITIATNIHVKIALPVIGLIGSQYVSPYYSFRSRLNRNYIDHPR